MRTFVLPTCMLETRASYEDQNCNKYFVSRQNCKISWKISIFDIYVLVNIALSSTLYIYARACVRRNMEGKPGTAVAFPYATARKTASRIWRFIFRIVKQMAKHGKIALKLEQSMSMKGSGKDKSRRRLLCRAHR